MKRLVPHTILTVFLAVACGFGWYWWHTGRYIETTDNAYIRGDITPISAKVSGYVETVLVSDNQVVAEGEPLVRIQDLEFKVRMEKGNKDLVERQAALFVATEKRRQQGSIIDLAQAQLTIAEIKHQREAEEFERFESLFAEEVISPLEYRAALARKKTCQAEMKGAEANLRMAIQEQAVLLAEERRIEAEIGQHREQLKLLQQKVADTCICAPTSGTVGNRRVRAGQYVRPGSVLMALIPLHEVWVEANFKEVQLARMQVGQPVVIEVDAFAGHTFSGRIDSLSPASGAEFSILPPENATGNFTKIVQRIPVKISIDERPTQGRRLLPGMSVEVRLDTRLAAVPQAESHPLAKTSSD